MARTHRHGPVTDDPREFDDRQLAGETLVGVHVDADASARGDGQEAPEVVARRWCEMWGPADQVDAQIERGVDRVIRNIGCRQRHQLDIHQVRQLRTHLHERPHASQGLVAHLAYEGYTTPFVVGGDAGNNPE